MRPPQLATSPIAIFVADFSETPGGQKGMVVTLDDAGELNVLYLGTDPATQSNIIPESKEINYDDVDEEHRKLLGIIRASQSDSKMEPREKIIMRAQVPKRLNAPGHLEDLDFHDNILKLCVRQDQGMLQLTVKVRPRAASAFCARGAGARVPVPLFLLDRPYSATGSRSARFEAVVCSSRRCRLLIYHGVCVRPFSNTRFARAQLFLTYTGTNSLKDVAVNLDLPDAALTKELAFNVASLKGGTATPLIMDITFYANAFVVPNANVVTVNAMFLTAAGEPRTAQCKIELPMFFFARLIPPVKEPTFKFKLDTNKPPVMLATLFEDMVGQLDGTETEIEGTSNYVLSFKYWVEDDNQTPLNATILLSKNAGRYRVQSHYLPALWFVGNELCKRLKKYFSAQSLEGSASDFEMWYDEPHLPLQVSLRASNLRATSE